MKRLQKLLLAGLLAGLAQAHVGSPDVYLEGNAGPYRLFVTVRPPLVIPGVAELEVRSETPGVQHISAVPLPIAGDGTKFSPVPDRLAVSTKDPQFFTGSLWMMALGSWQVRITVDGAQGEGVLAVPVASVPQATRKMQFGTGALLSALGLFLITGLVAMAGAGVREAKLDPGVPVSATDVRRGRVAAAAGVVVVIGLLWFGNSWWRSEAAVYSTRIYQPLQMSASLTGGELALKLIEPGWMQPIPGRLARMLFVRRMDDLTPDHGHLMHLYALREPGLDVVYHLHPQQQDNGTFQLSLPAMPAGKYKLYADIVHADGFPETMLSELEIPALAGRPLAGDDASAAAEPWQNARPQTAFTLPDGCKMEWVSGNTGLRARQAALFRFRLLASDGKAPPDMALYMGMLGHAVFVKTDGTVFAHVHPNGSSSMVAMLLAQPAAESKLKMEMPEMQMDQNLPNEVTFPYGFPAPGRYRILVQMKHGTTIETGVFDAAVN